MSVDRDATVRKAEKFLTQGKVAEAIEEYVRLVEDRPNDWNLANALGDLYVKAGDVDRAATQFRHVADHLYGEGFLPRAAAVYKKVLKVRGDDDHTIWHLAEIAGRHGLALDARSYYSRLIRDRRARGDERGAVECLVRVAQLDGAGIEATTEAVGALVALGESKRAAALLGAAAAVLTKGGHDSQAFAVLTQAAELDPDNPDTLASLADAAGEVQAPPEPEESDDLESIFEELRARVAHDQVSQAREQYERGLRHIEEGRVAEAMAILEEAARTPTVHFEASARLARLFIARDDFPAAVEWMERAVEAPPPTPEEGISAFYDLADALERIGEPARATAVLMELEADSPGHRDVRDRIARLLKARAESEGA